MAIVVGEDKRSLERVDMAQWYDVQRRSIEVFSSEGARVPLHGMGKGRSAFLLCSGPSLADVDLAKLNRRGIVTMAVNNAPAVLAAQGQTMPNYWVCVDTARHFIEQIWKDPAV